MNAVRSVVSIARRRPLLMGAAPMFALTVAAYMFSVGLPASRGASITGDEPFYLLTTQSLIQDGDLDLTNQYATESYRSFFDHPGGLWRQSVPTDDGRLLSPHNPGLSALLVPGFRAAGLVGAQAQLLVLAALTFALAYVLVARLSGAPLLSWLVTLAVALSATPFVYATEVYPEAPAALALVAALLVTVRGPRPGALAGVAVALLLTAMMWLGVKYAPLVAVAGVFFLLRAMPRARATLLALAVPSAVAFVWFHLSVFGDLTPYAVNNVYAGSSTSELLDTHVAFGERVYRLWGIFIDRRFGIARWSPLLLLAVPGMVALVRVGLAQRAIAALVGAQLAVATFVAITMMGWWFPGRTMMTVLPLFALPITLLLRDAGPRVRALAAALALWSLAITGSLAHAARSGEVTLAVDPFDMGAWPYAAAAWAFPQYTSWGVETIVLTVLWLVAGAFAVALALRPLVIRSALPRVRAPRTEPAGAVAGGGR